MNIVDFLHTKNSVTRIKALGLVADLIIRVEADSQSDMAQSRLKECSFNVGFIKNKHIVIKHLINNLGRCLLNKKFRVID